MKLILFIAERGKCQSSIGGVWAVMFYGLLFMFIIVVLPGMLSWRSLFTLAPNVKLGDDSPTNFSPFSGL